MPILRVVVEGETGNRELTDEHTETTMCSHWGHCVFQERLLALLSVRHRAWLSWENEQLCHDLVFRGSCMLREGRP